MTPPGRFRRKLAAVGVALAIVAPACGGGDDGRADLSSLTGFERDPAPEVGDFELPDLSNGGEPFALRADPGELLVVYFGYTNCPDFCPTTMSDLKLARNRLDAVDAERIDAALVTIDPERDLPILADYMGSFFEDGHALGTDDPSLLAQVAAPFGVTYTVEDNPETGETEVGHSTWLYAIDDQGRLALTWQFGVSIDELATDLEILLDQIDEESEA